MICQALLKNKLLKPSGPGALSEGKSRIIFSISYWLKGRQRWSKLPQQGTMLLSWNCILVGIEHPILLLNSW
jgi:hypothetical protein